MIPTVTLLNYMVNIAPIFQCGNPLRLSLSSLFYIKGLLKSALAIMIKKSLVLSSRLSDCQNCLFEFNVFRFSSKLFYFFLNVYTYNPMDRGTNPSLTKNSGFVKSGAPQKVTQEDSAYVQ
jgi:hypothetical protein